MRIRIVESVESISFLTPLTKYGVCNGIAYCSRCIACNAHVFFTYSLVVVYVIAAQLPLLLHQSKYKRYAHTPEIAMNIKLKRTIFVGWLCLMFSDIALSLRHNFKRT